MSSEHGDKLCDLMQRVSAFLREMKVPFALAGGMAAWARGGPDVEHDVDFLICEADKDRVLSALRDSGFRTDDPAAEWLCKAFEGDCLIDLIYRTPLGKTDVYIENATDLIVLGVTVPVMKIDDVLIMKLAAMNELYIDYRAALQLARTTREQIDWDYVRRETKASPFASAFFVLCEELAISP